MRTKYSNIGIWLFADYEGKIKKVAFNKLNEIIDYYRGRFIQNLLLSSEYKKSMDFLVGIKENGAVFGYELVLNTEMKNKQLYFSGALLDDEILIVGSELPSQQEIFLTGLMEINNDQTNAIRDYEQEARTESALGTYYYDEISRLNNQLVNMNREISKKNLELAQLNKLKNQFLGMAAHDLRNPLANIINFSDFVLEEKNNLNEIQLEFVEEIKSRSEFMLNMVSELLDVTNIETGIINLNREETEFISFTKNIIKLNNPGAERKSIKIEFEAEIDKIYVEIDRKKIEQVIVNLISNALKYSEPNKVVSLRVTEDTERINLLVADQGQGIPEDEMDILFKPYKRTSNKPTAGESSTGLGLYIVKRIVEAHNGAVKAESKYGIGSTFSFSLPKNK